MSKWEVRLNTLIICVMLAWVGFAIRKCDAKVTDYTGWTHECERMGGVSVSGKCIDPSALIDMEKTP